MRKRKLVYFKVWYQSVPWCLTKLTQQTKDNGRTTLSSVPHHLLLNHTEHKTVATQLTAY